MYTHDTFASFTGCWEANIKLCVEAGHIQNPSWEEATGSGSNLVAPGLTNAARTQSLRTVVFAGRGLPPPLPRGRDCGQRREPAAQSWSQEHQGRREADGEALASEAAAGAGGWDKPEGAAGALGHHPAWEACPDLCLPERPCSGTRASGGS